MPNALDLTGHMTPDTIAAFAEGRIDAGSREAVERHLATCEECRRDVVHIIRLRRRTVRTWAIPAGVIATAAVLLLMVIDRRDARPGVDQPVVRNTSVPGTTLGVVAPDSVVTIGGAGLRFVWRPVEPGARYQLTITTESGSRIYSAGTTDTIMLLPAGVSLDPGRTYLWFVDALRHDGRSVTTGVRVLRTLP
jgi:hypothetical protein